MRARREGDRHRLMTSAKAMLGALAGRFLFRMTTVREVKRFGRYVRLDLEGESLATARSLPGDKVQVFLPDVGMRTYTPLRWTREGTSLLVFSDGQGPGASWARDSKRGDEVSFFGPRRSIEAGDGPVTVFGDETSVAISLALAATNPTRKVTAVLEVSDAAETRAALDGCGSLVEAVLVPRGDMLRAGQALQAAITPETFVAFTGRAASIQAVKRVVRAERSKTKAYWAEGKVGLD